jgi:hypothetical protein
LVLHHLSGAHGGVIAQYLREVAPDFEFLMDEDEKKEKYPEHPVPEWPYWMTVAGLAFAPLAVYWMARNFLLK